jgi:hypothetical protein
MSSLRRLLSSRANGAKSRGPKTPEGKRVSSMNALQHGLAGKTLVLRSESQAGFDDLHQACIEHFQPQTRFEEYLVREMAGAKWRQSRACCLETAALDLEMDRQSKLIDKEFVKIDNATRTALAFQGAEEKSKAVSLFLRYEARSVRAFREALDTFGKTAREDSEPSPANLPNEPSPISGT